MDTTHYKRLLEEEGRMLETQLNQLGTKNPDNPNDWEPVAQDLNIDRAEEEEQAGAITDFEDRVATEFSFEDRHNEILRALARIADGTYGVCLVCGEPIEEKRLEANPAAETCITHKEIRPDAQ